MKKALFILLLLSLGVAGFASMPVIDPELRSEMNLRGDNDPIEIVVLMQAQYDRQQLSRQAAFLPTKAERRDYVVNELKVFAEARR